MSQWKKEAAEGLPEVFARKADQGAKEAKEREKELFEKIGRLKIGLEWLKEKAVETTTNRSRNRTRTCDSCG